jgi:hypothetical protein
VDSNWHGDNVTVTCTSGDAGSGLANPLADTNFKLSTSVALGGSNAAAPTGSRSVCDNVGNCTTVGPFTAKVDRKPPTGSCLPAPDAVWHSADVAVTCMYSDPNSGLATPGSFTLSTHVPLGTSTTSAFTTAASVCDTVGNCVNAGPIGPWKVDKKNPSIVISTPTLNAVYTRGQAVTPGYTCYATGPAVTSCNGAVPRAGCTAVTPVGSYHCTDAAGSLNTASVGLKTFTVTAMDGVHTATVSQNYYVTFNICPLFTGPLSAAAGGPITVAACDGAGHGVSTPSNLLLTAVKLLEVLPEPHSFPLNKPFTFQSSLDGGLGGYSLTLTGFVPGNYILYLTVAGDPPGYVHQIPITLV